MSKKRSLKKVTEEDIRFIRENFSHMTIKEMANRLGLAVHRVQYIIKKLKDQGLIKYSPSRRTLFTRKPTQEDVEFIFKNYHQMQAVEIADRLGLTVHQVHYIIKQLRKQGLIKNPSLKVGSVEWAVRSFIEKYFDTSRQSPLSGGVSEPER